MQVVKFHSNPSLIRDTNKLKFGLIRFFQNQVMPVLKISQPLFFGLKNKSALIVYKKNKSALARYFTCKAFF